VLDPETLAEDGVVISFADNQPTGNQIRRAILRDIGSSNVQGATRAVVTGYRSSGGNTALGALRAAAVRTELLKINPRLTIRTVDAGTRASGRDECVKNQCAIVRLLGIPNTSLTGAVKPKK